MDYCRLSCCLAALILGLVAFSGQTSGQESRQQQGMLDSQRSIEQVVGRQFNNGPPIATASMTTPARWLNKTAVNESQRQIRVKIRYLMVDDENRTAIYQQLAPGSVQTKTQQLPDADPPAEFPTQGSALRSSRTMTTTSCVSTCIMDTAQRDEILNLVSQSTGAKVTGTPTLILLDGNEGQMDEIIQRPFVVGLGPVNDDQLEETKNNASPAIQVVDEGISMRVRATSRDDAMLQLASEVISKKIVGVEQTKIYGLVDNAVLQRPIHQVEKAVVAAEMKYGQTLMIDPYISSEVEVQVERGVPIIGKIPYINRSFKNTASAKMNAHWMILIEPQIEMAAVQQVSGTQEPATQNQ